MQLAMQPFPHAVPADTRARNAGIALVACAAVLLVGIVSRSWFTARGGSLGLLGIEECRGAVCHARSWFDFARAPTELKLFSTIGIVGIVVALGLLGQAAGMLVTRQAPADPPLNSVNVWVTGRRGPVAAARVGSGGRSARRQTAAFRRRSASVRVAAVPAAAGGRAGNVCARSAD